MKKLIVGAFGAVTLLSISYAQTAVSGFGDGGWYSSDTRSPTGANLRGSTASHADLGGTYTAGDDALIANNIKFMGEGQSALNANGNAMDLSPAGSLNGLGYVRLDGTESNSGKSMLSLRNTASGFGTMSSLVGSGWTFDYRWYGDNYGTPRTLGTNFWTATATNLYVFIGTNGPSAADAWNTVNLSWTSGEFSLRRFNLDGTGNTAINAGATSTMEAWSSDAEGALAFGGSMYEIGFLLGSSQRNTAAYLDWAQSSMMNGGQMYDFQAVPEPATMSVLALAGLAALRRRNKK